MKEIDHENTANIVCPYCGYEDMDSWEFKGDSDEELEHECDRCGETFLATRFISVSYYTRKTE